MAMNGLSAWLGYSASITRRQDIRKSGFFSPGDRSLWLCHIADTDQRRLLQPPPMYAVHGFFGRLQVRSGMQYDSRYRVYLYNRSPQHCNPCNSQLDLNQRQRKTNPRTTHSPDPSSPRRSLAPGLTRSSTTTHHAASPTAAQSSPQSPPLPPRPYPRLPSAAHLADPQASTTSP